MDQQQFEQLQAQLSRIEKRLQERSDQDREALALQKISTEKFNESVELQKQYAQHEIQLQRGRRIEFAVIAVIILVLMLLK